METYKKIETEESIKAVIEEILREKKSDRARKTWLTKAIEETNADVLDLEEILSRPMSDRYRLGDFITRSYLINAKRELKVLTELRGVPAPADPWISFILENNPKLKVKARREPGVNGSVKVVLLFNTTRVKYFEYKIVAVAMATELLTLKK